ncbi:hypothetical protein [Pectobacterium brasiliense]|uniref:hypothetical protein n=1 Tax=Pectobacterium brasiliense TaxID=180957 RepID=UPI0019694EB8|nr:hypothetical protein [Pectobacterium brasiliense]MBN3262948.1 hypothetical protein [Pectobacterium brasiliense]
MKGGVKKYFILFLNKNAESINNRMDIINSKIDFLLYSSVVVISVWGFSFLFIDQWFESLKKCAEAQIIFYYSFLTTFVNILFASIFCGFFSVAFFLALYLYFLEKILPRLMIKFSDTTGDLND